MEKRAQKEAPDSINRAERIGRHRVVSADAPEMVDALVVDSFLHWKGLERPAALIENESAFALL